MSKTAVKARAALIVVAALVGCSGRPAADASQAVLRGSGTALVDPTLRPARLVPARSPDDAASFGAEPGGALRTLVAGVRVINLAGGGVLSAADPLPSSPSATVEVPERMGGGFLFAIGPTIYRADKWLAPLRMLYVAPVAPTQLFVGLDRAYVRLSNNAYAAFDPRIGTPMDLGPWPASPQVSRYVAADGWRAAAIADLRGLVATFDAGSKWQPVPLPIEPRELRLVGDAIVATGPDTAGEVQAYAVQPNGQVAHVQQEPPAKATVTDLAPEGAAKALGKRPLLAAVLDGWPLSDGTVLVARDGVLARVRIADGTVIDSAPDAFPLKPARCHPVSLGTLTSRAPAAFGFVCGEPHGTTEIYSYDAGRMHLLRHFDTPRSVSSPANGTLAVEGPCDAEAPTNDGRGSEQHYCLMRTSGAFEDFVVNGDVGAERVVPLADGRTAIISPPAGDLATARLTLFDGSRPTTIPLTFQLSAQPAPSGPRAAATKPTKHPSDDDDDEDQDGSPDEDQPQTPRADEGEILTAVLRSGTWLRGFEERKPGVLSGWVEHSGTYVGLEVTLDGHAKSGRFVRELGSGMVSGRYGLGWSSSRQGYETTDGGMTWKPISLPEPLESSGPAAGATTHGCGPLGCVLAGWVRVGWGGEDKPPSERTTAESPREIAISSPPALSLRCELVGKLAAQGLDVQAVRAYDGYSPYGYGGYYGRRSYTPSTRDWLPFYGADAPKLGTDDLGFSIRTDEIFERAAFDRTTSHFTVSHLARLYAWGPRGVDWDVRGRFMVRFSSPFESSSVVRTTQSMAIPHYISDAANFVMGTAPRYLQNAAVVPGDDDGHVLLVIKRAAGANEYVAVELESERPPTEVHRTDGAALGDVESAVRMSGKWYVATSDPSASVVWEVENGLGREVTRVPRAVEGGTRKPLRLVKRADGRVLGGLVEGSPMTEGAARPNRWLNQLWVLPIDVDAGTTGEPERLGPVDGSGKRASVCGPQDGGWVVDGRWPGTSISVNVGASPEHAYSATTLARYRITPGAMCVEKLAMNGDSEPATGALGKVDGPFVTVGLFVDRARQTLRCVNR